MDKEVAIITGGASGIGLATALQLLRDGFYVHIIDRRAEQLAAALETLRAQSCEMSSMSLFMALAPFSASQSRRLRRWFVR